jgi:hypothetical protein
VRLEPGDPTDPEAGQRLSLIVLRALTVVYGNPDPAFISTSDIERQNLTVRMAWRRFTRLTNAFSKKLDKPESCPGAALRMV